MRQIIILASLLLVIGASAPRFIDKIGLPNVGKMQHVMTAVPVTRTPPSAAMRSVTVEPDRQGHFRVAASVNGQRLDFMIDTGASVIALSAEDAARLGIHPVPSDFTAGVRTANGLIKASPTQLRSVEVGGLVVREVQALVLPEGALSENLLGLSFLSRLRRFEYAHGRLVLEQ